MGYELTAFIGRDILTSVPLEYPAACVIPLRYDLQMIPLTIAFWNELELRNTAGSHVHSEQIGEIIIRTFIADFAQQLSETEPIAYVEAGFLGGTGSQQAIIWQDGQVALSTATFGFGAINQVLRYFGIQANDPALQDEFIMVGLGQCRYTEHWTERNQEPQANEFLRLLQALAQSEKELRELRPESPIYQFAEEHKNQAEQQLREFRQRERK
ncbi:hypothetical protein KDA_62720 [Dictyobacter alpinus]|uniref:Uncharacterized protein n=1 Tax=Dictyobacter alpinus TaxID=2014873 RepID=A0A402BH85_9CHLR|nr:hypothetical protein [Dictyobacter alpinus]GCE30788.1 hypothetical protein KDA_62720 [Dictyobacter alpinus]